MTYRVLLLFGCFCFELTSTAIVMPDKQAPQIIEEVALNLVASKELVDQSAQENTGRVKRDLLDRDDDDGNTIIVNNGNGNNNVYIELCKNKNTGYHQICKLIINDKETKTSLHNWKLYLD